MVKLADIQNPVTEERIAAMFNRIAGRYDLLNRLLSMRQDQRWRKAMIKRLPVRHGARLVDVATGTGDVLLAAAKERPDYSEYLGVDISEGMLQVAATKLPTERQDPRFKLAVMSAEKLLVTNEYADAVTIAFGLRNVVDREQALREFARVLKPNGALLILEFFLPRKGLLSRLFQFYFHQVLPRIGGFISDGDAYRYLPQSVGGFYTLPELDDRLRASGFRVVEVKRFLFGACNLVTARRLGQS